MPRLPDGFIFLDDPRAVDPLVAGGKTAGLAAVRRAGLPAPPGLIVLPEATLPDSRAWPDLIQAAFPDTPTLLAVRSSAVGEDATDRSFAGLHRTLLGVRLDALEEAVRVCRASLDSAQARAYRDRYPAPREPRMAVLIQPLVYAQASGVAFGADPVTGDMETVVVEAVAGLGRMLVDGRASPHRFTLRRSRGRWTVTSRTPGAQHEGEFAGPGGVSIRPVNAPDLLPVDGALLVTLADAVRRAGEIRGAPQDVEWAVADGRLTILQSRPITTLPDAGGTLWTRANFREVLPDIPSRILLSIWSEAETAMDHYYRSAGFPIDRWGANSKCIKGRLYFNASRMMAFNTFCGLPASNMDIAIGHGISRGAGGDPYAMDRGRAIRNWRPLLRLAGRQARVYSYVRRHARMARRLLHRLEELPLESQSDAGLIGLLEVEGSPARAFMDATLSVVGALMSVQMQLASLVRGKVPSIEGFIGRMTAPGAKTVSAKQGLDLLGLAREAADDAGVRRWLADAGSRTGARTPPPAGTPFARAYDRYLRDYGHRAVFETDPARPRFREDPTYLLAAIAETLRRPGRPDPASLEAARVRDAREAWGEFTGHLGPLERLFPVRTAMVRLLLRRVKRLQAARESVRSDGMKGTEWLRRILLELGRRWTALGWLDAPADVFDLTLNEVRGAAYAGAPPPGLRPLLRSRRAEQASWAAEEMPNLLRETPSGRLVPVLPPAPGAGEGMRGIPVSGGRARGPAAVIRTPDDFARMRAGAVLVAPATDPAWSPLFAPACAVVVEMGGILSHGSILAREYGIPAVVNIPGLCAAVRDGEMLEVDGWQGSVRRVERAM